MHLEKPKKSLFFHFTPLMRHYSFQKQLSQETFRLNSFFFYNDLRNFFAIRNFGKDDKNKPYFYQKVN